VVRSGVRFRRLSEGEIARYVASGAPLDKAGAYGIQDPGYKLVERVGGSYYNVVGLPVRQVLRALEQVGKEE
jgi:septum formation protein